MGEIKDIIKDHYKSKKDLGVIYPEMDLGDFMDKLEEEVAELHYWYAFLLDHDISTPKQFFIEQAVDVACVIFDMCQHYGIDFKQVVKEKIITCQQK